MRKLRILGGAPPDVELVARRGEHLRSGTRQSQGETKQTHLQVVVGAHAKSADHTA